MKRILASALLALAAFTVADKEATAQDRLPEYIQAEKFTQEKLNTMLFSTVVDTHWFQQGNCFWYSYKTSEGTFWYVMKYSKDPVFASHSGVKALCNSDRNLTDDQLRAFFIGLHRIRQQIRVNAGIIIILLHTG